MPAAWPHGPSPFRGKIVTHRQILEQSLGQVLARLPDERLRQILDFAEFLSLQEEQQMWSRPAAEADELGPEDDEYTEAEAKPRSTP
jgi:hypothetical protein